MLKNDRPAVLFMTKLETQYNREALRGVMAYARRHTKWHVIPRDVLPPAEHRTFRPAGMLSANIDPQNSQFAHQRGIPLVLLGHPMNDSLASSVSVDEVKLGAMAAEYLLGLGLKHFAYVGHASWPFVSERLHSFTAALNSLGHGPVHQLIGVMYDYRRRPKFVRELEAMLQRLPRPCGLLAANDDLGAEVVTLCLNLGLRVPDDIAVVGVDDDQVICERSDVPLSSVVQPVMAIGYESARLLHEHMLQPDLQPTQLLLPPLRVVARASSDLIAIDDEDVAAALRLINDRFTEPINATWVVRQLPVARRTFYNRFNKLVGRTILEQIHHVRLSKAKELLAESNLDLEVVAQRSGFANARWLADSFRRMLQISPTCFRRQFRTET